MAGYWNNPDRYYSDNWTDGFPQYQREKKAANPERYKAEAERKKRKFAIDLTKHQWRHEDLHRGNKKPASSESSSRSSKPNNSESFRDGRTAGVKLTVMSECTVCQERMGKKSELATTKCKHTYHKACLQEVKGIPYKLRCTMG